MQKYAVKGNREIDVENDAQAKDLVKQGYDIVDGDGKLITAGRGKSVPYEQFEKVKTENETLKVTIKELEKELKELKKS